MSDFSKMFLITQTDYHLLSQVKEGGGSVVLSKKQEGVQSLPDNVAVKLMTANHINTMKAAPEEDKNAGVDLIRIIEGTLPITVKSRAVQVVKYILNHSREVNKKVPWNTMLHFNEMPATNIVDLIHFTVADRMRKDAKIPPGLASFITYLRSIHVPSHVFGNHLIKLEKSVKKRAEVSSAWQEYS